MTGTVDHEVVIGLEVHVELATRTKLFCACPNEFGAEPNTNVCPVCLGLPGSLPVLNEQAVEFALRFGEALGFDVPARSVFARKNYFYPDMPKDYQISQYEQPVLVAGSLDVDVDGTAAAIGIQRAHLEEDTGKTLHAGAASEGSGKGRIHEADHSLVDYNRAGVPLMEVVSEPEIRSAEQARAYVTELRSTLEALGVSDVKMEEGSLRIDANVSLRPAGSQALGTKVEVKNMNSLRSLGRAVEYEVERQAAVLDAGEAVAQETRHWDEDDGCTHAMRSKEEAFDYRYFPEPDLVTLAPPAEWRERVRASLPELPSARRARLVDEWGLGDEEARVLVSSSGRCTLVEEAVALGADPRRATIVATNDVPGDADTTALSPQFLHELLDLEASGTISKTITKSVLERVLDGSVTGSAAEIVEREGLSQESDEGALGEIVDQVLGAHSEEVDRYRSGDDKIRKKLRGFLMGRLMAETKGQGNPQVLNRLLDERLG